MPTKINPPLSDLQRWMRGVITHPDGVAEKLKETSARWRSVIQETADLSRDLRLDIYGNAYFLRLIDCLGENFPAVKNVVGEHNFYHLAHNYLVKHPSTFKSVEDVGATLAGFISSSSKMKEFPFLADLTRLEWAAHEAFYADDVPLFDTKKLKNSTPSDWLSARFELDTSVHLLSLRFPVDKLWRDDGKWTASRLKKLHAEKCFLLVFRKPDDAVRVWSLTSEQFGLLGFLQKKKTLSQSLLLMSRTTKGKSADLPIQNWFRDWMESGVIRNIQFSKRTDR